LFVIVRLIAFSTATTHVFCYFDVENEGGII